MLIFYFETSVGPQLLVNASGFPTLRITVRLFLRGHSGQMSCFLAISAVLSFYFDMAQWRCGL